MELKDTVELMTSEDYKERFQAEYYQTKVRRDNLSAFITRIDAAASVALMKDPPKVETPAHDSPVSLLKQQLSAMDTYLHVLEIRAVIENISL